MATTPTVPVTLQSELSAYAHKVLLTHLGALVLILALVGFGVYRGFSSYDKLLAHAEALQTQFTQAQAQYSASQKQLTDLLATDSAERAQESSQQAALVSQIEAGELTEADLKDEIQLYTLEVAQNASLTKDLTQCVADNTQAKQALADAKKSLAVYDKLAHRSKFRKILGGVGRNLERVGIAIVAFEVGKGL